MDPRLLSLRKQVDWQEAGVAPLYRVLDVEIYAGDPDNGEQSYEVQATDLIWPHFAINPPAFDRYFQFAINDGAAKGQWIDAMLDQSPAVTLIHAVDIRNFPIYKFTVRHTHATNTLNLRPIFLTDPRFVKVMKSGGQK